jgi:AraC-like DNA-binding protein
VKSSSGDAHRGYSLIDTLNLRLFSVAFVEITPTSWKAADVCSSYWRFYRNDSDGAELLLYDSVGEKEPFPLRAEETYLIPAGVRFDCRCKTSRVGHFYVHFEVTGLPGLFLREVFHQPVCLPRANYAKDTLFDSRCEVKGVVGNRTDELVLFCRAKSLVYDALALSLTELRVVDREKHQTQTRLLEPVLPALNRIESHLASPLTNGLLADICCLSEDYFIRRFKECVGESPAHYIQRRRIETAANRLLFSADSIDQIATECGFGNRFHFTRAFKNRVGIAPATYRHAGTV